MWISLFYFSIGVKCIVSARLHRCNHIVSNQVYEEKCKHATDKSLCCYCLLLQNKLYFVHPNSPKCSCKNLCTHKNQKLHSVGCLPLHFRLLKLLCESCSVPTDLSISHLTSCCLGAILKRLPSITHTDYSHCLRLWSLSLCFSVIKISRLIPLQVVTLFLSSWPPHLSH